MTDMQIIYMDGEAEIITRDQRLIEHFIEPVISLFRNR